MRPMRDLMSDLVERRLWPIAVLLVAALVAVPLVLAKSPAPQRDDDPATVQPPAAVASATPVERTVVIEGESRGDAPLRGEAKNPFRQQHQPPEPSGGGDVPPVDTGAGGGAPVGGSGEPPSGGEPPAEEPAPTVVAIDVRFGKAIGVKRMRRDVPRLTPLPSAARPIVIFLGMRKDRETAVFMISSDVHAQGDGKCVPSRKLCESIELKEGDVAFLDVAAADGTVDQYELELVAVTVGPAASEAAARAAYRRVSPAGARLLRRRESRASANTSGRPFRLPFRYVREHGVLHVAPWVVRVKRRQGQVTGAARHAAAVGQASELTP